MSISFRRRTHTRGISQAAQVAVESLEQRQLFAVGDLDPTFGAGGRTVVSFPPASQPGNPDFADRGVELRKIDSRNGFTVIAGEHATGSFEAGGTFDERELALARLDAAGNLDASFDADGTLYSGLLRFVTDLHVQEDNKILVAGSTILRNFDEGFALLRFNADGSLDSGFGGGDGIIEFDFVAASVAEQPDGKIMVGGHSYDADGGFVFAAARLLTDGTLDGDYGNNGITIISSETLNTAPPSLSVQPADGKLIMVGNVTRTTTPPVTGDALVIRLTNGGNLDQNFSGNGKAFVDVVEFDSATAVDVSNAGNIFVGLGGLNATTQVLARLNSTGNQQAGVEALDRAGTISEVRASFDSTDTVVLFGVLERTPGAQDLGNAIIRYNTDGTLDTTFGSGAGYIFIDDFDDAASSMSGDLQADGKILAATGVPSATGLYQVAVSRWLASESDPTVPPGVPPTVPPGVPPTVPPGVPPTVPPGVPPTVPPGGVSPAGVTGALVTDLPPGLVAGEKIRGGKAIVAITNPTQDMIKGRMNIGLFISTDEILDQADPAVVTRQRNLKLKPGQTKNVKMKVKTLPVIPAGAYQLLTQITAPDQTQTVVAGDLTFPVAAPTIDLVSLVARNIEKPVPPGGKAAVSVTVQNVGNVVARGPLTTSVFASADAIASPDDTLLRLKAGKTNIKPGQSKTLRLPFRLPAALPAGAYFVTATVDSANQFSEPDEANNIDVAASPFPVVG